MAFIPKLNPPQISGKLPAFYGNELIIPFSLNRAVGFNQFDSMVAIVKTVSTNTQVAFLSTGNITRQYLDGTTEEESFGKIWYDNKTRSYRVSFKFHQDVPKDSTEYKYVDDKGNIYQCIDENGNLTNKPNYFIPKIGQYYKIQLACVASGPFSDNPSAAVGYYSSVGVIKCTGQPDVEIKGLLKNASNKNVYEYVGTYLQIHDMSEKVYSYEFNLYDEFDNIVATSGVNIHNNSTDIDLDSSFDVWRVRKNLIINKPYYLQYKTITMNGLGELIPCESPKYQIMELDIAKPNICAKLSAKLNDVEGYIQLSLIGQGELLDSLNLRSGSFVLLRSSSKDDYDIWEQLTEFQLSLYDPTTNKDIYRDYVVEQGIDYIYAIQAYNQQGYMSGRLKNFEGKVHCDFEDAFLYDGEKQLKIRFNPTIDSFKSTILENKVDTIGNKYPFIFRNGIVNYKEFSISGLLSLLGDENKEFTKNFDTLTIDDRKQSPALIGSLPDSLHQLTGDNYFKERQFKLKVLEWLSDGKPKLFKSPAEGNYIVRLMNVTLSPEKTLGRMLHTFNCNACEIAECNFNNLDYYNLIPGYNDIADLHTYTFDLNDIDIQYRPSGDMGEDHDESKMIQLPQTYMATITGAPGTVFKYYLTNDKNWYDAQIGSNGIFVFPEETLKSFPLTYIELISDTWGERATLIIGYKDPRIKTFSYIYDVSAITNTIKLPQDFDDSEYENLPEEEVVLPPFYDGIVILPEKPEEEEEEIIEGENEEEPSKGKYCWMKDILKFLEDLRRKTGMFHYINISLRDMCELVYDENGKVIGFIKNGRTYLFENGYNFDPNDLYFSSSNNGYFDGWDLANKDQWTLKPLSELTNKFVLNDKLFNMGKYEGKFQTFTDLSFLNNFRIGNGLKVEVVYQEKDVSYSVDNEASEYANAAVIAAKKAWEEAVNNGASQERIKELYNIYLEELRKALEGINTEVLDKGDVIYAI